MVTVRKNFRGKRVILTSLLALSVLFASSISLFFSPEVTKAATKSEGSSTSMANDGNCTGTVYADKTWDIGGGFSVNVNAGLCYDGNTAWLNWNPTCTVTIPWWASVTTTKQIPWCGLWVNQNNPFETNLGINFNLHDVLGLNIPNLGQIGITLRDADGWYRVPVYGDGSIGEPFGGLNAH